jgi:hypothetical protein
MIGAAVRFDNIVEAIRHNQCNGLANNDNDNDNDNEALATTSRRTTR